jgi:virginiamycin B lyase
MLARRFWIALVVLPSSLLAQAPSVRETAGHRHPIAELPVTMRVPLPRSPDWLAIGYGSVWVVNYKPDRLSRVDPHTGQVTAEVSLGPTACLGIVIARGSVWVPTCGDGMLNEIDPATNHLVRRIPVPIAGGREGSFAFSDGSFWLPANVPDSLSPTVVRIDARSGAVQQRIAVGARADVAVAGFGAVWVASSATDTVFRIDPTRNAVVARIAVGRSPKFMTVGAGALWVQNRQDGSVSRIDPITNREVARIETHAPTPWGDIAAGNGAIWLSVDSTPVTRIDPHTNTVSDQFVGGSGADAIRIGYGALWVADHEHGEIWRIDLARLVTH